MLETNIASKNLATMTFTKEKRPTNMERVQNVGLFGRGCGNFDAFGNAGKKKSNIVETPSSPSKKKNNLLGDFTLYRVNKEFENFWRTDIQDNIT